MSNGGGDGKGAHETSSGSSAASGAASRTTKFQNTLNHLEELLDATPSSEELATTWNGSNNQSRSIGLRDLHRQLEAGKRVQHDGRGIPMWIVVRAVKASWHADGSWPLRGHDEMGQNDDAVAAIPQSIHPSSALLRPKGQTACTLPQTPVDADLAAGKVIQADPDPQDIADAYAARGVQVGEPPVGCGFEDW